MDQQQTPPIDEPQQEAPAPPTGGSVQQATDGGNERNMALLAHLLGLAGYIFPFGNIIGPLVIMLTQQDKSSFAYDQARESLNFQITVTIAAIVATLLIFAIIGIFLLPLVMLLDVIFIILAAVAASRGERYRYPLTIRLIT